LHLYGKHSAQPNINFERKKKMSVKSNLKKTFAVGAMVLASIPEGHGQVSQPQPPQLLFKIAPSNPLAQILDATLGKHGIDFVTITDLAVQGKVLLECQTVQSGSRRTGEPFPIFKGCTIELLNSDIANATEWTTSTLISNVISSVTNGTN
jgi:hypothetical protein